ncbi:MAG: DHH family phosphoesterase [Bacillota bacterium]|nr:DHH family phosphoesterase [Bacillota bacterium]
MNNKLNVTPLHKLLTGSFGVVIVILFIFATVTLALGQIILAIIEYLFWLGVTIYIVNKETTREKELMNYIKNLSFITSATSTSSLIKFPLPLVTIRMDNTIVWFNDVFVNVFESDDFYDRSIHDLLDGQFDINDVINQGNLNGVEVEANGKTYTIFTMQTDVGSADVFAQLFFVDTTAYKNLKHIYENSRMCYATIIIDDFADVLKHSPDESLPVITATVEKVITDWTNASNGILKKYEADKYIFIFEYKYFLQYSQKHFDILEHVRSISLGNRIPFTLSIGIGIGGESLAQDAYLSGIAIDTALGRGGNQVVVRDSSGNNTYYGGNSYERPSETRLKPRIFADSLKNFLAQSDVVLIMGHTNADIDSFGSSVALCHAFHCLGFKTYIILDRETKSTQRMSQRLKNNGLDVSSWIISGKEAKEMITPQTLLVVVDVFIPELLENKNILGLIHKVIAIDHHRMSENRIDKNLCQFTFLEPSASSACEMVTEILRFVNDGAFIDEAIAEALYAGIVIDTNGFTFRTGTRTFEAAAYLRKVGVDTLSTKQLFQNDLESYATRSGIVERHFVYKDKIAISSFSPTDDNADNIVIAATAADDLLEIDGINASFVICSSGGIAYISGRSLGGINVQVILEKIGGGGHASMAATQIPLGGEISPEDMLKGAIDKYLEENKVK